MKYFNNFINMKKVTQHHLPKSEEDRQKLISTLSHKLNQLTNTQSQQSIDQQTHAKIQILKRRMKLIGDCNELSVDRIEHLQQIFKHYCTHIFKIGKHMTFERLQYEKVHLTLDRLCVFLKDFSLTVAEFDGEPKQIVDKNDVVRIFKRMSSNCRDLSFEEFIASLQKIAPLYYEGKENYNLKVQQSKQERDKRIAEYKKRIQKKKNKRKIQSPLQESLVKSEESKLRSDSEKQQKEGEENDKLVEDMMKDSNIENPNEEIDESKTLQKKKQLPQSKIKKPVLQEQYELTLQQKVQAFYQMIGVDNVKDFRKKMGQLGLPMFKQPKKASSTKKGTQIHVVIQQGQQEEDHKRLIELRQKLNKKRERDKLAHSPVMSKEDYEERKKKRQEKQNDAMREMARSRMTQKQTTIIRPQKKKVDLTDKEVSLDMVNHISFDELKYKFDPKKYVAPEDQDHIYLMEYGNFQPKTQRNKAKDRTNSTMEIKKRTSTNIVRDFKKRAEEIQKNEFNREAKLTKFMNKIKNNQKILSKF